MRIALILIAINCITCNYLYATNDSTLTSSYTFIIKDSPSQLNTMRAVNQNYLSTYRYVNNELLSGMKSKNKMILQTLGELFFLPLTHEEGHRSILTSLNIGSISQPFFNLKGAAYVKGVSDRDLISLRTTNLPSYIRLHTAGLESDYMLSSRIEETLLFNFDEKINLFTEFYFRKASLIAYYTLSLIPSINPKIEEETNELERDIVGHDVYGVVKNLHRPNEQFYRYTNYDDLTSKELRFLRRVGYRALINVASPIFFKKLILVNKTDLKLSLSAGYSMSPFGDFMDENIYVLLKENYKIHAYLRQFENKHTWFPAGGVSLTDFRFSPKFSTTCALHLWSQPENMDFNTSKSMVGGATDVQFKYNLLTLKEGNSISFDVGLNYKTKGFLPEEVQLNEHFGVRMGFTLHLLKKQH